MHDGARLRSVRSLVGVTVARKRAWVALVLGGVLVTAGGVAVNRVGGSWLQQVLFFAVASAFLIAGGAVARWGNDSAGDAQGSQSLVHSAYLEQVQRIAPSELRDRDREVAALAAYCTEEGHRPYVWWQAGAWAGKSALMSWFVLHPPAGARVVSFFVTAAYASQSDRVAFTDVVLEQLAELLGKPMPPYLTEPTREAHLLRMLKEAAEACQRRGQRLVLVVDGLDEDLGVTSGPDAHSIAALLPAQPPPGMRVVVVGRPHPPVPDDVPDKHPLRDPAVVRILDRSPRAEAIKADARRELKRLLLGSRAEQDLLGLVAAAGGGLSGHDLAELTGLQVWQIEEHLHAVAGRTFRRQVSWSQPGMAPDVYLLAHEELQQEAARIMGGAQMDGYQQRLHAWADRYREQGWPPGTPEYLLRGYYERLCRHAGDVAGMDLARMVTCATDQARHDRMLDRTGGDATALTEISTTQDAILAQPEPDLLIMARLAVYRDSLAGRSNNIPTGLPAVWATLGRITRAETLAQSITDVDRQADALAELALAMTGVDLDRAEHLAHSITDVDRQADALAGLARKVVRVDLDRAEKLARSISDAGRQMDALADLVGAIAAIDPDRARTLFDQAETLARTITGAERQARAKVRLAAAVAAVDPDRAEGLAESITYPAGEVVALVMLAATLAGGKPARARALVGRAEAVASMIGDPLLNRFRAAGLGIADVIALYLLSEGIEEVDDVDPGGFVVDPEWIRAETDLVAELARKTKALDAAAPEAGGLGRLVRAVAANDPDGMRAQFDQFETLIRTMAEPGDPACSQADTRHVETFSLLLDRVETVVGLVTDQDDHEASLAVPAAVVARIAEAVVRGEPDRARALLDQAEALARSIDPVQVLTEREALMQLPLAAARVDPCRAETLLGTIMTDPRLQAFALPLVVQAMTDVDPDRARALADRAESLILTISDQDLDADERAALAQSQARALTMLAEAMVGNDPARADRLAGRAEAIARTIADYRPGVAGLAILALEEQRIDPDRAHLLFDRLFARVKTIIGAGYPLNYLRAMRELAEAAAVAAAADPAVIHLLFDQVISLTYDINDPDPHIHVVLAEAVAAIDRDRATALFDCAESAARTAPEPRMQAFVLGYLAEALRHVDPERARSLFGEAETIAGSITDPSWQAGALGDLAEKAADTDLEWARVLFDRAETLACSIADRGEQADVLAELTRKAADADPDRIPALFDQIETLLHAICDSNYNFLNSTVALHLAGAMARLDPARAAVLADQAERLTRAVSDAILWGESSRADALAYMAEALAGADPDRAEALARSITDPERQAQALAAMAERVAPISADRAEALAQSITDSDLRTQALANIEDTELALQATIAARADPDRAEALAQKITDTDRKALVLANLAREATPARARRLIAQAFHLSFWAMPLDALAEVQPATLTAIADDLLHPDPA
jgi:hypothetical protein